MVEHTGHYDGVVMDLEARGAKVVPVFAGGLDFSSPVAKFFYNPLDTSKAYIDVAVSLTGFALVGGPARQDAPKAVNALEKLGVPYIVALPLVFQTTNEWLDSSLGVHPVQVALQACPPFFRCWYPTVPCSPRLERIHAVLCSVCAVHTNQIGVAPAVCITVQCHVRQSVDCAAGTTRMCAPLSTLLPQVPRC